MCGGGGCGYGCVCVCVCVCVCGGGGGGGGYVEIMQCCEFDIHASITNTNQTTRRI